MSAEIVQAALQLLKIEAELAWCTENGAHSWQDVRAIDPVFSRSQQIHRRRTRQQYMTGHPDIVRGRKEGGLTFGHELVGATTALTEGATPTDDTLGLLLKTSLGNSYSAAGSECEAGCTTTVLNCKAGQGSRFRAGTVILVENGGAAGVNQMSVIKSVSTDAITLEFALGQAPSDGDKIWNSYSYYLDRSQYATLQAQLIGEAAADVWLALGVIGGFSLQNLLQLEEVASAQFDLQVAQWDEDTGTLSAGSYDEAGPVGTNDEMELHIQDDGTTTRNLVSASMLEIAPAAGWTIHRARGAAEHEHAVRARQTGGAAVGSGPTARVTVDIDDDFRVDYEAGTKKMLALMAGRTAGAAWAVVMPRGEIVAVPERGEHSSQTAYTLSLEAHQNDAGPDSSGVASSSYLMRSPLVICRL